MNTIWTIMYWIVCGFELFGLAIIAVTAMMMLFNPGNIEWIDRIRNYMLMIDEEDFE